MKFKSITKTALGAALVGFIFSMIQLVTMAMKLSNNGYHWTHIALILFSGMKWVYIGLIILFLLILFRPQSVAKGAWALGICSIIQLVLAAWNVNLFFTDPQWTELLGNNVYFFLIDLAVPLALLVFSILMAKNIKGTALRSAALFTGLALLVTIAYTVFVLRQSDVFTIFDIVSAGLIAQWFWVLFLEYKTLEL
jgi:hypothetical protein